MLREHWSCSGPLSLLPARLDARIGQKEGHDHSRFLVEYGTGLYVGNASRRVADALWARAIEAAGKGEVVFLTSAAGNEQGFRVQLHQGGGKEILDMDGYELLRSVPEKAYKKNGRFLE